MKIDVLGCGSAFSCTPEYLPRMRVIAIRGQQTVTPIDSGPTVPRALWQRGGEQVNDIDAIYFTHVHPDHCTGLQLSTRWKSYLHFRSQIIIYCQPAQQPVLMQLAALANWPQADLRSPSVAGRNAAKPGRGRTGRSALPHPA